MPYDKFKRENAVCVARVDAEGNPIETIECYEGNDADAKADKLLAALRINVEAEERDAGEEKQDSRENDPEWYAIVPDPDLKSTWKLPLMNFQDVSNAIQALSPEGFRGNRVEIPRGVSRDSVIRKISARISDVQATDDAKDKLRERLNAIKALGRVLIHPVTIFKGADGLRYMFLITSNSYQDREKEFITTKALRDYVESSYDADDTFVGRQRLLFQHRRPAIGQVTFAEMAGAFLIEIAKELPSAYAKRKWDEIETSPGEWGASHGFNYLSRDRVGDTYYELYKFESSVLPIERAANLITLGAVRQMSKSKRFALFKRQLKLDDNDVEEIEKHLAGIEAILGANGIGHKEVGEDGEKQDEEEPEMEPVVLNAEDLAAIIGEGLAAEMGDALPDNAVDIAQALAERVMEALAAAQVEMEIMEGDAAEAAVTTEERELKNRAKITELVDSLVDSQAELAEHITTIAEAVKAIGEKTEAVGALTKTVAGVQDELKTIKRELKLRPRLAVEALKKNGKLAEIEGQAEADEKAEETYIDPALGVERRKR